MNDYLYKLVTQDLGFGRQVEDALKKLQAQKELEHGGGLDNLILEDEDYAEFSELAEEQKKQDEQERGES